MSWQLMSVWQRREGGPGKALINTGHPQQAGCQDTGENTLQHGCSKALGSLFLISLSQPVQTCGPVPLLPPSKMTPHPILSLPNSGSLVCMLYTMMIFLDGY